MSEEEESSVSGIEGRLPSVGFEGELLLVLCELLAV